MKMIRMIAMAMLMGLIAACGGGGGGGGGVQQPPPMPTISGTPWDSIVIGDTYRFTPVATDATSFSISNKPKWASFDEKTGALTGQPTTADAGTYDGIVISAKNSAGAASLPQFSILVLTAAKSATVTLFCNGPLPGNLSGMQLTYMLPPGVTPTTDANGNVDPGAIVASGITAGQATIPTGMTTYVAPTESSPGSISFVLSSSAKDGFGAGEVAKITLQVADSAHPMRNTFAVTRFNPVDLWGYPVAASASDWISFR